MKGRGKALTVEAAQAEGGREVNGEVVLAWRRCRAESWAERWIEMLGGDGWRIGGWRAWEMGGGEAFQFRVY